MRKKNRKENNQNKNSINKTAEIFITLLNELFQFIDLFIIIVIVMIISIILFFFVGIPIWWNLIYSRMKKVVDISNGQYYFLMACI